MFKITLRTTVLANNIEVFTAQLYEDGKPLRNFMGDWAKVLKVIANDWPCDLIIWGHLGPIAIEADGPAGAYLLGAASRAL